MRWLFWAGKSCALFNICGQDERCSVRKLDCSGWRAAVWCCCCEGGTSSLLRGGWCCCLWWWAWCPSPSPSLSIMSSFKNNKCQSCQPSCPVRYSSPCLSWSQSQSPLSAGGEGDWHVHLTSPFPPPLCSSVWAAWWSGRAGGPPPSPP